MGIQTGIIEKTYITENNLLEISLLSSLAKSAEIITSKSGWVKGIDSLMADLGRITNVSRVWIFQVLELDSEQIIQDYAFEWAVDPKYIQLGMPVFKEFSHKLDDQGYRKLIESRKKGEWQKVITNKLEDSWLKSSLAKQDIKSMLTIPIIVEEVFWGVLGFDDCKREYDWPETEITLLRIASFFISSAVLQNRLSSREKQFNILQQITSSGIWEYDIKTEHLWASTGSTSGSDDLLANKHLSLLHFLKIVHKDDRQNLIETVASFFKIKKEILTHDLRIQNKKGNYQWIEIIGSLGRDSEGKPSKFSGIIIQVDARKKIEIQLKKEAETDHLTGVLNRRIFWKKLEKQIEKSRNRNNIFSLIVFDIDFFKKVNDTWGHSAGDNVLKHFTSLCLRELREGDYFARIGGEEFALILQDSTECIARKVGERILAAVESIPCVTKENKISITTSAGCISYIDNKLDSQAFYKKADEALYMAKECGRNRIICFSNMTNIDPQHKKL